MTLMAGVVFGGAGMAAWSMGRRRDKAAWMLLGVALMVYPWVVEGAALQWGVGLVALLFVT